MVTKMGDKSERIVIRCHDDVKNRWARFAATRENSEKALIELLDEVEAGENRRF